MPRKSIFEIMEENFDLYDETKTIDSIFSLEFINILDSSIENYIDKYYFLNWQHRGTARSSGHLRKKCGITSEHLSEDSNEKTFLTYFEYVYNIMMYLLAQCDEISVQSIQEYTVIINNLNNIAETIHYKYIEIEELKYILVEKNSSATAVAEILEDTKVLECNHYLSKGNVKGKKDTLNLLANRFEKVKANLKQNGYKDLADTMGYLFNNLNIRHAKDTLVKDMSSDELEEWYDKTYDIFLLCILADNHVNMKPDIKSLKQKKSK